MTADLSTDWTKHISAGFEKIAVKRPREHEVLKVKAGPHVDGFLTIVIAPNGIDSKPRWSARRSQRRLSIRVISAVAAAAYRVLATQGDGSAQFKLGAMYDGGKGVEKNGREAMRWYLVASAQGSSGAAYNLGQLYHDGNGIPQNYKLARRWYRSAADRGSIKAAVNLGFMEMSGEGGPRDYKKAIEWYLFAAKRGNDRAKINMGVMYQNALGVRKNLVIAHMWYNLAAAHGEARRYPKQKQRGSRHDYHGNRSGAADGKRNGLA